MPTVSDRAWYYHGDRLHQLFLLLFPQHHRNRRSLRNCHPSRSMKRYTPELEKKCKERSSEMSAYLLSLDKSISDPLARAEAKREIDEMKSVDILCRLHSAAFFCKSLYESFVRQRTTSSFLLSLQHSDMDNFNNLLDFYDTHCQPPK